MAITTVGNRFIVKRSAIDKVVPTIPSSTGETDWTTGFLATDLLDGEFFTNTYTHKVWQRQGNSIILISSLSGQTDFITLKDTPSTYAGSANFGVFVNSGATGLIFSAITAPTTYSTQLTDMPSSLGAYSGYTLAVNKDGTKYEFIEAQRSFTGLTDVIVTAYTQGNIIKFSGGKLINYDPTTQFVDLTTISQSITSTKEWDAIQNLNAGVNLTQPFNFTGVTNNISINNISNDSSLSAATEYEIATSLAIRTYVSNQLMAAAGFTAYTGNFITTNTSQVITGTKTFNTVNVSTFSATSLDVKTLVYNPTLDCLTFGTGSIAYAADAFAAGNGASAMGTGSVALNGGYANDIYSFAAGSGQAKAVFATAFGQSTAATGNTSTAFGINTLAAGDYSFVAGNSNVATGEGTAIIAGQKITGTTNYTLYTNNIEIVGAGNGIIMQSSNNTRFKLSIADNGTLNIAAV